MNEQERREWDQLVSTASIFTNELARSHREFDAVLAANRQIVAMCRALGDARHCLATLGGLRATDRMSAYSEAQSDGADANGAWDAFRETLFTIDTSAEVATIDAALASAEEGKEI